MYLIMKFVLVHTSFIMLMLFFSLVIYIVFTPIFIRVFSVNWRIGTILDYSKIDDKYAIRKKLYPELYQDENE